MSDPIEALTEILQQHIGCYSDDRSRERCVVHGTDWPCEALSDLVSEVQSWAEKTYLDVLDCEACRNGEHGLIDEVINVCRCCGERQQPKRQWCRDDLEPMDLCSVCWTDHADGIPFPDPAKEDA